MVTLALTLTLLSGQGSPGIGSAKGRIVRERQFSGVVRSVGIDTFLLRDDAKSCKISFSRYLTGSAASRRTLRGRIRATILGQDLIVVCSEPVKGIFQARSIRVRVMFPISPTSSIANSRYMPLEKVLAPPVDERRNRRPHPRLDARMSGE